MSSLLQGEPRNEVHLNTDDYDTNWYLEEVDNDALNWFTHDTRSSQEQVCNVAQEQQDLLPPHQATYHHSKEDEEMCSYLKILHEKGIITLESDSAANISTKHPYLDVRGFTVNPTVPDGMFFAGYLATFVLYKKNLESYRNCPDDMPAMHFLGQVGVYRFAQLLLWFYFFHQHLTTCLR